MRTGERQLNLWKLFWVAALALSFAGCSTAPVAQAPDPATLLQKIPAADAAQSEKPNAGKAWPNPYLVLRQDGVGLLDTDDNMEKILKPDQILNALAELPPTAWPKGRMVLVQEGRGNARQTELQKNRGAIKGILEGAHVAIVWLSS